jgi:predicted transcriptional regulator
VLVGQGPGATQAEVVRAAAQWGWNRRTTQDRLHRLVRWGLVAAQRRGRTTAYSLRMESPSAPAAAQASAVEGDL